ncbi:GNAT family N-acetyltransferase [Mucilaginibacter conchicola]|uniref:GNAT family N-acetyltransferase n=1 Tax=Mucilaginibacter conchicola TaxID=2303333 RepID=A0A372NP50_9SPHI|nr:GNAT family N-acetyltransferase [Mucilaginibacter conchicola]RFZ90397.1 GNAT family N-acetyltransferase [Mucilaginibacter conchicola]
MIRPATTADAQQIAPLILLAMGPLAAKFANSDDVKIQTHLFVHFIMQNSNQYSYQNILVDEDEGEINGMIIAYDGALLDELRRPFLNHITQKLGFTGTPEDETQAGEYYIDCLAVLPHKQGLGTGRKLIKALCDKIAAEGHLIAGLLVSNPDAKRLYESMGFKVQNTITLLGGNHEHLHLKLNA